MNYFYTLQKQLSWSLHYLSRLVGYGDDCLTLSRIYKKTSTN